MGKRTPLYEEHVQAGGKMVDFAGWDMPIQYGKIQDEHAAVRTHAGMFDVSHMGRLRVSGPGAFEFLNENLSIEAAELEPGRAKYGFLLNERGGIQDDLITYRREKDAVIVANASNTDKVWAWLSAHKTSGATLENLTENLSLIAVQGPKAVSIVERAFGLTLQAVGYYRFVAARVLDRDALLARTGYTGEDGFELFVDADTAAAVWKRLLEAGKSDGLIPCGLGSRDTLRTEAGMPLYGHEINEATTPFDAGLAFGVSMKKPRFVGRAALETAKKSGATRKLVGFDVPGGRTPRPGNRVLRDGEPVGAVTSGTFSFTLQKPIGIAAIAPEAATEGLGVELRPGKVEPVRVVPLPFYRRPG